MKQSVCSRRPRCGAWIFVLAALFALLQSAGVQAATYPSGFSQGQVAGGLVKPTAMAVAPDGRLFICEQEGRLRVVKNGQLLPTPFVSLDVDFDGERGLVGIVLDPNFGSNGWVYLFHTVKEPFVHNRITRFTASGDVAAPGSGVVIFDLDALGSAKIHNGGAMRFGGGGKLYVASGENAQGPLAQSLSSHKGKILRLNPDGSIPADNPYYNTAQGPYRAIYALGFRNPFSLDVHPTTGRIFANDVGAAAWEEINEVVATGNYGWPAHEGPSNDLRYQAPLYAYSHSEGAVQGCAITGGVFYSPARPSFPAQYSGKYFFTDYCSGWIYTLDTSNPSAPPQLFASDLAQFPVDLKLGADGSLYYIAYGYGAVFRIAYTPSQPPRVTAQSGGGTLASGSTATFEVSVSGDAPLTYAWFKNNVVIPNSNSPRYTTPALSTSDSGARFSVSVTNAFGNASAAFEPITVTARQAPRVTIDTPVAGTLYRGGSTLSLRGSALDNENAAITADASYEWKLDFHHDAHAHPLLAPIKQRQVNLSVPARGETSDNVWLRISLTVRDAQGLSSTVTRDIFPQKQDITLATSPAGLQLTLDGVPFTAPRTTRGVVGVIRELGAPAQQVLGGVTYEFIGWSDGGAATHEVATPEAATTYTATYRALEQGDYIAPNVALINPSGWENRYERVEAVTARGTASDNAGGSGLREVRLRLRRLSDGLYWNTEGWQQEYVEINLGLQANWSLTLPSFENSDPSTRYALLAISMDNALNQDYAYTEFFVNAPTDSSAPTVAVTSPVQGWSYGASLIARGTVRDALPSSGIARVSYALGRAPSDTVAPSQWWNGSGWGAAPTFLNALVGDGTWEASLPNLSPDGFYTLRVVAADRAANQSSVLDRGFWVDTTAPTSAVTSISNGYSYRSLSAISGTAQDAGPGVHQVLGRLFRASDSTWWNGSAWTSAYAELPASGTTQWSLRLPALRDDRYVFNSIARDYRGNAAASPPVEFWIDTQAPTVVVNSPQPNVIYASIARAVGTARDAGPGVFQVRGRLFRYADSRWWNGTAWTTGYADTLAQGTTNWSWSFPTLTNGRYVFAAIARDYYGNTTTTAPIEVTKGDTGLLALRVGASTTSLRPDPRPVPGRRPAPQPAPRRGTPVQSAPRPAPAPSGLSTASANATSQQIALRFTPVLDAATASRVSSYAVWINGRAASIESVRYVRATNTLSLQLAPRTIAPRSVAVVTWSLRDARGAALAGRATIVVR
jgi:glucose/arabinose dehydrogenase